MTPEEKRRRHRNERIAATIFVLICTAAVVWFVRWNAAEEAALRRDTTYVPKRQVITAEHYLLREYIRINTVNPPGNELAGARWLGGQLAKHGIAHEIIESAPGRGNLYARVKGKRSGEGLLLLHHIDVVTPTEERWSHPPFEGEISVNQLFGRGAIDMKGHGICHLLAFIDVAKAPEQPERDIVFLAVADEEAGSRYGMLWLLEKRPELFEGIAYVISEGGLTEVTREQVKYYGIELGGKTATVTALRGTYEQLQRTRIALEPFMRSDFPEKLLPEVRTFFKHLAPQRFLYRDELADIDRAIARGRFWRLPPAYRELLQNTVVPRTIERDARGWWMSTLLYNLPDQDPEPRIAWLREHVAQFGVTVEVLSKEPPIPISSDRTPFYDLIRHEVRRVYGNVPSGTTILGYSTNDSRHLRRRGVQAYGITPFPVDVSQSASIHRNDERVRLDWFLQGIDLTRGIVRKWAFAPAAPQ